MVGQFEGCYRRGRLKENGWTVRGMPSERKTKRKWLDSVRDAIGEED